MPKRTCGSVAPHVKLAQQKEALKAALGKERYDKIVPDSIRVEGDDIYAKIDLGPAGHKLICVSLSEKKVKWSQG